MICAPYKELMIPENLRSPNWEKALEYLRTEDWRKLPIGRTEIDGPRVVVLRQSYTSKQLSEVRYETHRRYADIQMVFEGRELALVCFKEDLKPGEPYSEEKDVEFYEGEPAKEKVHTLVLADALAAVFFPWDAHRPNLAPEGKPGPIEKIVVKVAL